MNNSITSYDDLKKEEQRLTALLQVQKEVIKNDFREIKEELTPVFSAASTVMKFATYDSDSNPAVKIGTNLTIDWLVQKLFPRSSVIAKMIVPTVLKNYSSHYLSKAVPTIKRLSDKISGFFRKKKVPTEAPELVDYP